MPAVKIALVGSAPSSVTLAPYGDPTWAIFGCSPGVFAHARRVTAWIELHRWEPGVIGCPETQKPWFSPEYVAWMAKQPLVWMHEPVAEIPNSKRLPIENLLARYGTNWFTSSVAYMLAMSIDEILAAREQRDKGLSPALLEGVNDAIGLYGIDMAATEEWGYQRAGCQHFILLADSLGIDVIVPAESDLLRPMPLYGLMESTHWHIKLTARKRELEGRLANCRAALANCQREETFLLGALDDMNYHMQTWAEDRTMTGTCKEVLALVKARALPAPVIQDQDKIDLRQAVWKQLIADADKPASKLREQVLGNKPKRKKR